MTVRILTFPSQIDHTALEVLLVIAIMIASLPKISLEIKMSDCSLDVKIKKHLKEGHQGLVADNFKGFLSLFWVIVRSRVLTRFT